MMDDNTLCGLLGLGMPLRNSPLDSLLGMPPESPLSALARALAEPRLPTPPSNHLSAQPRFTSDPTPSQGLGGLARLLGSDAPSMTNALVGIGITQKSSGNVFATPSYVPPVATLPDVRRRTFFSFQFSDSFRVNQVRQSWRIRPKTNDPHAPMWFHDSSIWEKSQRTKEESLKQLIREGLDRSSVTAVLAGATTFSRRWVRYEVAQSVQRGNGLLTVYIDGLQCPNTGFAQRGPNPLDHIGLYMKRDGSFRLCVRNVDGDWWPYDDFTGPIRRWPRFLPKPTIADKPVALSVGADQHDYCNDGYKNLSAWIQAAAVKAGK